MKKQEKKSSLEKTFNLVEKESREESRFISGNKVPLKIVNYLFVEEEADSFGVDKERHLPPFSW